MWKFILLLFACVVGSPPLASAAAEKPLNVILIMADDVGYECFGAYGSKQYRTPRLDALADSGVRFTHCYSTPLCTPSRVTLMTGKNSVRNYLDFGVMGPGQFTLPDLFRTAGYRTAIAGKWQLQGSENAGGVLPKDAGFDEYWLWNTPMTTRSRFWNPSIEHDGALMETTEDDYGPDIFADSLIDFMGRNRERPFFVYYPMALVHNPFLPTPDSTDRQSQDKQRNFEDMVAYTDTIVGRISDAVERLGLADRTILMFTSDNGTHSDIVSELNGRSIRGGKGTPTDDGTRVPFIVRGPQEVVRGGRVLDDLIDFTDFFATLAEIVGARMAPGDTFDGRSFLPQLKGEQGNPREWLFSYYFPRPYGTDFDHPYRHREFRTARDKRFKLYPDGRLFDLTADVLEQHPITQNVGAAEAARRKLQAVFDSMPPHGALIPERLHQ